MTPPTGFPDELAAVAADDRVFDALAAGRHADPPDDVTMLLADWRGELDCVATTAPSLQEMPTPPSRWSRPRRHATGAAVAALTLAVSTGVAAAASGSTGPFGALHRALFGGAAPGSATTGGAYEARIVALLDGVATRVERARAAGGISETERAALQRSLDSAAAMIADNRNIPPSVQRRLDSLRAAVAALPTLVNPGMAPTTAPSADRHGESGPGVVATPSAGRDGGADTAPQHIDGGGSDTGSSPPTSDASTQPSDGSGSGDAESSTGSTATTGDGAAGDSSSNNLSGDASSSDS